MAAKKATKILNTGGFFAYTRLGYKLRLFTKDGKPISGVGAGTFEAMKEKGLLKASHHPKITWTPIWTIVKPKHTETARLALRAWRVGWKEVAWTLIACAKIERTNA